METQLKPLPFRHRFQRYCTPAHPIRRIQNVEHTTSDIIALILFVVSDLPNSITTKPQKLKS